MLVNYTRSDDDHRLLQLIKLTIIRSTSEERQYIVTDIQCQMMSRNQSVCMSYPKWWSSKMCFFCFCSRLCVTQEQLLLEFEMCNVMFVSTILKNISEGRRSDTCILEFKRIIVERVKIFSVLTFSLTNLRHMMLHWIESKSFWW